MLYNITLKVYVLNYHWNSFPKTYCNVSDKYCETVHKDILTVEKSYEWTWIPTMLTDNYWNITQDKTDSKQKVYCAISGIWFISKNI